MYASTRERLEVGFRTLEKIQQRRQQTGNYKIGQNVEDRIINQELVELQQEAVKEEEEKW